jgi:hypothetical protein
MTLIETVFIAAGVALYAWWGVMMAIGIYKQGKKNDGYTIKGRIN